MQVEAFAIFQMHIKNKSKVCENGKYKPKIRHSRKQRQEA